MVEVQYFLTKGGAGLGLGKERLASVVVLDRTMEQAVLHFSIGSSKLVCSLDRSVQEVPRMRGFVGRIEGQDLGCLAVAVEDSAPDSLPGVASLTKMDGRLWRFQARQGDMIGKLADG